MVSSLALPLTLPLPPCEINSSVVSRTELVHRQYRSFSRVSQMSRTLIALVSSLAVAAMVQHPARAQFQALVARVPAEANSLVLLNVEKILAGPQSKRAEWRQKLVQAFASGEVFLTP